MKKVNTEKYTINRNPELISDEVNAMIINIMHLSMLIEHMTTKHIGSELSFNQLKILSMIESGICSRSSDFALHLNVSKANMTGMIGRLEKGGYIYRKEFEDDYRVKILTLTEKGKLFVKENRPLFYETINGAMKQIDKESIENMNELFSKCIGDLREALEI